MVIGSALGPLISGVLIDVGFNLNSQYILFATYFILSSALLFACTRKILVNN